MFSSSTQIVFIYLVFCICLLSPFSCPDFPAAKSWDLLSGSLSPNPFSSHGTFPPSLSLPGKARCCKCRLKTPRSLQPFVIRQKISTQAQTQILPLGYSAPQGPFRVYKACCAVAFRESRILDRDSFCLHCVPRLLRACCYLFGGFIFVLVFLLSSYNLLAGLELA